MGLPLFLLTAAASSATRGVVARRATLQVAAHAGSARGTRPPAHGVAPVAVTAYVTAAVLCER